MNTFKIFLNTYKPSLYMVLMPMGLFIVLIILQIIRPSHLHEINKITCFLYFLLFSLFSNICTRLYDKKPLYLLPTSRRTKFFMPLGIAFLTIIATCLLTIPIEAVAHLFTMSNAPEQQIVIGGFLKNSFTHNSAIFFSLVIGCAFVFIQSLVRNKIIMISFTLATTIVIMNQMSYVGEFLMSPPALSTIAIIKCLAISAIFIAASYLIFKRWQPANDGIFRV